MPMSQRRSEVRCACSGASNQAMDCQQWKKVSISRKWSSQEYPHTSSSGPIR